MTDFSFLSLENFKDFKISLSSLKTCFTALGLGVVAGFLSKKVFGFLVSGILISLLILKGLEIREIIFIDWNKINLMLGIAPATTMEEFGLSMYEFFLENIYFSFLFVAGFLIGYKAG